MVADSAHVEPAAFSVSIVGTSCWMNDVKVDAPIMSPAAAKIVLGFCGADLVDRGREPGDAGGGAGLLDAPVEVVDGHEVDVDRVALGVSGRVAGGAA